MVALLSCYSVLNDDLSEIRCCWKIRVFLFVCSFPSRGLPSRLISLKEVQVTNYEHVVILMPCGLGFQRNMKMYYCIQGAIR